MLCNATNALNLSGGLIIRLICIYIHLLVLKSLRIPSSKEQNQPTTFSHQLYGPNRLDLGTPGYFLTLGTWWMSKS